MLSRCYGLRVAGGLGFCLRRRRLVIWVLGFSMVVGCMGFRGFGL